MIGVFSLFKGGGLLILGRTLSCQVSFVMTCGRFVGVRPVVSVEIPVSRSYNTPFPVCYKVVLRDEELS